MLAKRSPTSSNTLAVLYGFVEVLQTLLSVGEEHHGFFGVVEEGVVHACETWAQGALDEDDVLGVLDGEHGHPAYGALHLGVVGRRVYHVVGADDDRGVGIIELGVYVLEVVKLLVGDAYLGEEYVHVSWHPACDRVDAEKDLLALGLERLHEVPHSLLGLGDGEAVTWYDHDLLRLISEVLADLRGTRVGDFPLFLLPARTRPRGRDTGEDNLAQRTSQRARHEPRQDGPRGADQRAADNEGVIGEHEARGRRRESGKRVEQRDHDGHVSPADGDNEQDAEQQRSAQDQIQRDERREHGPSRENVHGEKQNAQENGGVHHLLQRESHRAGQCQFLELGERDDAPREAHRPDHNAEEHGNGSYYGLLALA